MVVGRPVGKLLAHGASQKITMIHYTMIHSDNNNYTFMHSEKACDCQNKLTELPRK